MTAPRISIDKESAGSPSEAAAAVCQSGTAAARASGGEPCAPAAAGEGSAAAAGEIAAAGEGNAAAAIGQFYWIRIISCFAIILLHILFASNVYFEETITDGELLWSKIAENMLMWAVPCFLMVTGALLLDPEKELSTGKIYGKYLKRVVTALLAFTLIFQVLGYLMEGEETILTGWLQDLFLGQSWAHMWYLYLMIGIYLMLPFYRIITKYTQGAGHITKALPADTGSDRPSAEAGSKHGAGKADHGAADLTDLLMLLLFVFTSVPSLFRAFGAEPAFYIPTTVVYPLYLFMGYRLCHKKLPAWAGAVLFGACSAAIVVLTFLRYESAVLAGASELLSGYEDAAELD